MSSINMQSIISKATEFTESSEFQEQMEAKIDEIIRGGVSVNKRITVSGINMAAAKFIEVLQNEIRSHAIASGGGGLNGRGLGDTAVSALINLKHGIPVKVGKNQYEIEVRFDGDLERDSLAPDFYSGDDRIKNIAALLNNGYSAAHTIYGTWQGHGYADSFNIPSLREREGLHFIQNAIRNYMTNYAPEYGVINIEVDDVYK